MELLCERARSWSSLRTDRELSELESALLDNHLGRCRSCRAFARGIEDVSAALAAARLERPAPLALVLPQRRGHGGWLQSAALSMLVVVAGAAALVGGVTRHGGPAQVKPVAMLQSTETPNELRELRRATLIFQPSPAVPRNRQDPGESY
jgi:predicted anti-sigma-YlaC factor YlaD